MSRYGKIMKAELIENEDGEELEITLTLRIDDELEILPFSPTIYRDMSRPTVGQWLLIEEGKVTITENIGG